jgi:hypothetical protein
MTDQNDALGITKRQIAEAVAGEPGALPLVETPAGEAAAVQQAAERAANDPLVQAAARAVAGQPPWAMLSPEDWRKALLLTKDAQARLRLVQDHLIPILHALLAEKKRCIGRPKLSQEKQARRLAMAMRAEFIKDHAMTPTTRLDLAKEIRWPYGKSPDSKIRSLTRARTALRRLRESGDPFLAEVERKYQELYGGKAGQKGQKAKDTKDFVPSRMVDSVRT